jgi:hypothetical protein
MEGLGRKVGKGTNLIVSFLFRASFCSPHTGLSHQGQWPKAVEATITILTLPIAADSKLPAKKVAR